MGKRILQIALTIFVTGVFLFVWIWLQARPAKVHPYFVQSGFDTIAHRGGRGLGPENTLAAFRLSLANGADVLEMDVRSSADGHLIVLHDDTVDRTTDGNGTANEMTLTQLKKLDAGYHWTDDAGRSYPFRNRGITIPTLPEIFATIADTPLIIEIKEDRPSISRLLCAELRHHNRIASVLVASVHRRVLQRFRTICPRVATSAGPSEAMWFYTLSRIGLTSIYSPNEQALLIPQTFKERNVVSARFVEAAHGRNLYVAVWTVNSEEDMRRLIAAGVDGILTDYPDRLVGIMKN